MVHCLAEAPPLLGERVNVTLRMSFREPIPEIEQVATMLDQAVDAHAHGRRADADELLRAADVKVVWDWSDSVWGKKSPYILFRPVADSLPRLAKEQRKTPRYATSETKRMIHQRDGFYCRFCKIPVITGDVRSRIRNAYPEAVRWDGTTATQHAGFSCMWAQYDHIVPHARGGGSDIDNVYLTCAACNYGRMNYTLEEVGLAHPADHAPRQGSWDGLERFR